MKVAKNRSIFVWILVTAAILTFMLPISAVKAANDQQSDSERPVADGIYKLVSAVDNSFVWDIGNASSEDGANLQLYTDNNTDAQKFELTYDADGYYIITNVNSGKVIECVENADGAMNVQQNTSNNSDAQKWKPVLVENGYYTFISKYNEQVVDVTGGTAGNGVNIQMFRSNNTPAQQFRIVETAKSESQPAVEHTKGFFSSITFVLLGVEAVIVIGIGYYFQVVVNKKGENKDKNKDKDKDGAEDAEANENNKRKKS